MIILKFGMGIPYCAGSLTGTEQNNGEGTKKGGMQRAEEERKKQRKDKKKR